jgi:hypothetical protein
MYWRPDSRPKEAYKSIKTFAFLLARYERNIESPAFKCLLRPGCFKSKGAKVKVLCSKLGLVRSKGEYFILNNESNPPIALRIACNTRNYDCSGISSYYYTSQLLANFVLIQNVKP